MSDDANDLIGHPSRKRAVMEFLLYRLDHVVHNVHHYIEFGLIDSGSGYLTDPLYLRKVIDRRPETAVLHKTRIHAVSSIGCRVTKQLNVMDEVRRDMQPDVHTFIVLELFAM